MGGCVIDGGPAPLSRTLSRFAFQLGTQPKPAEQTGYISLQWLHLMALFLGGRPRSNSPGLLFQYGVLHLAYVGRFGDQEYELGPTEAGLARAIRRMSRLAVRWRLKWPEAAGEKRDAGAAFRRREISGQGGRRERRWPAKSLFSGVEAPLSSDTRWWNVSGPHGSLHHRRLKPSGSTVSSDTTSSVSGSRPIATVATRDCNGAYCHIMTATHHCHSTSSARSSVAATAVSDHRASRCKVIANTRRI
jgi:hypothetical protein